MKKKRKGPNRKTQRAVEFGRAPAVNTVSAVEWPRPPTNTRMEFTMVPLSNPSDHELQAVKPPSGHSGVYRVTFVLCIPGKDYFRSELDIERIIHAGESLLQMPSGAGEIEITVAGSVPVIFSAKTDGGVMSHVTMRIETESFIDAERFAYDRVMPILSYWSYLYDVALDITGYDVLEEETGIRKFSLGLVGMIKAFNEHEEYISTPEHRRLFAAYREGMNATNLFYQVLSFFKVSEGIRSLWKRRHRKAGRKGTLVNECVERFPDRIEELQIGDVLSIEAFRPHLGKELVAVLDEYRSLIRDAVAHLQQMDDVLDADNYDDITKCEQAVPVLRHIARSLLANELSSQQSTTSVAGQFRE